MHPSLVNVLYIFNVIYFKLSTFQNSIEYFYVIVFQNKSTVLLVFTVLQFM